MYDDFWEDIVNDKLNEWPVVTYFWKQINILFSKIFTPKAYV